MKIINFGSINIDRVYNVPHFVKPGETISSAGYSIFAGGKGFNQSTALARAGADILHAGVIGYDGQWLKEALALDGADIHLIRVTDLPTGHAVIQVDETGQNSIIIEGGANKAITDADIDSVFAACSKGDILLVQNEISELPEIMRRAKSKGMEIVFNPAPMSREVLSYPLDLVSLFIVNEIEAAELCGVESDEPGVLIKRFNEIFPSAGIVLTLGSRGAVAKIGNEEVFVPAKKVNAVDTTAAGDTFIGYFLAERQCGLPLKIAMETATAASAVSVSRMGAAPSIPRRDELLF